MSHPAQHGPRNNEDAAKAMRFLALKAAIFILVPLAAAAIAVVVLLK